MTATMSENDNRINIISPEGFVSDQLESEICRAYREQITFTLFEEVLGYVAEEDQTVIDDEGV